MPISNWLDLMPSTIKYEAVLTRDDYGKPLTYNTLVNYRARVTYKHSQTVSRVSGEEVMATGVVWINAVVTGMHVGDRITLADGTLPQILNWETISDERGPHHTKVYFSGGT